MKKMNLATQVLITFIAGTVLGIIFQKDILPFLNAWYMGSEIRQNNKD